MPVYQFHNRSLHADDPAFQDALAAAHAAKQRPRCVCRPSGVDMYVARVDSRFVIKRMPDTGREHAPDCESFEPPPELSGLGEVAGTAIKEDVDAGTVALQFAFSMSKTPGRSAPVPSGGQADSVKTDGTKLTLRGMLHYLWEQAGFNRWVPAMLDRRTWYSVRKYLLQAAEAKTAKKLNLADLLYIPEPFNLEQKADIAQRRTASFARLRPTDKGARPLMLVIGEVKQIGPARYGHKFILKQLPDCHFMMNEDLFKRLEKRFAVELELWTAFEGTRLMVIGTFGMGPTGVASMEEVALMVVTDQWLPFESAYEKQLLDTLVAERRRFTKGLRYNMPADRPLATAVLSDTSPAPTALYIEAPETGDAAIEVLSDLIESSHLPSWVWKPAEHAMPALPAATPSRPA